MRLQIKLKSKTFVVRIWHWNGSISVTVSPPPDDAVLRAGKSTTHTAARSRESQPCGPKEDAARCIVDLREQGICLRKRSSRTAVRGCEVTAGVTSQVEVDARELRVTWTDRLITDHLNGPRTLLKGLPILDGPAVPINLDHLRFQWSLGVTRAPLNGHRIAAAALEHGRATRPSWLGNCRWAARFPTDVTTLCSQNQGFRADVILASVCCPCGSVCSLQKSGKLAYAYHFEN
jgi:hypothetical protein